MVPPDAHPNKHQRPSSRRLGPNRAGSCATAGPARHPPSNRPTPPRAETVMPTPRPIQRAFSTRQASTSIRKVDRITACNAVRRPAATKRGACLLRPVPCEAAGQPNAARTHNRWRTPSRERAATAQPLNRTCGTLNGRPVFAAPTNLLIHPRVLEVPQHKWAGGVPLPPFPGGGEVRTFAMQRDYEVSRDDRQRRRPSTADQKHAEAGTLLRRSHT